jgi:hypothetical protein
MSFHQDMKTPEAAPRNPDAEIFPFLGDGGRRLGSILTAWETQSLTVALHSQTDVIDRLGCAIDAVSLRADDSMRHAKR